MGVISTQLKHIKTHLDKSKDSVNVKYTAMDMEKIQSVTISQLPPAIDAIPVLNTKDATAKAGDILEGMVSYGNGARLVGTMKNWNIDSSWIQLYFVPDDEQPEHSSFKFRMDNNDYTKGYMAEKTRFRLDKNVIAAQIGLTPDIIKEDAIVLEMTGTYKGLDATSDATAIAANILYGKTAWVNSEKITGTMPDMSNKTVYLDFQTIAGAYIIMENSDLKGYVENTAFRIPKNSLINAVATDGTAKPEDILDGKTAYSKDGKIEGTLPDYRKMFVGIDFERISGGDAFIFKLPDVNNGLGVYSRDADLCIGFDKIANAIGLTADMIKKGVTVLGVTGTYEATATDNGSSIEEDCGHTPDSNNPIFGDELGYLNKWGFMELFLKDLDNDSTVTDTKNRKKLVLYRRLRDMWDYNGQVNSYYVTKYESADKLIHVKKAVYNSTTYPEYNGRLMLYIGDISDELTNDDIHEVVMKVRYDNPELMIRWLSEGWVTLSSNGVKKFLLIKNFDESTRQQYIATVENTFNEICGLVKTYYGITYTPGSSFYSNHDKYTPAQQRQIAKVIHDFLVLNNTYHDSSVEDLDQTIYPALSKGAETPVCASYALAFLYCCERWGILAPVILGYTEDDDNGYHMWNMVAYVKGRDYLSTLPVVTGDESVWQEMDVTWDDPTNGSESYCGWDYFNITTSEIQGSLGSYRYRAKNHVHSAYLEYPVDNCTCTSNRYTGNTKYGGF